MRIWDEDLIKLLCDKHLLQVWREGMKVYHILQKEKDWLKIKGNTKFNPAVLEFAGCPIILIYRLELIYKEAKKRKMNFQKPPGVYDVSEAPMFELWGQMKNYVPWQTKQAQIEILKQERCCRV